MYEILLAVDRDENRGKAQARTVREMPMDPDDVDITLLHVFEDNPTGASVAQVAAVRRAREILEEGGYDVTLTETSGHAASEIVETAENGDYDLVVLAGRKRSATGKLLFGSTTQEVLLDLHEAALVCQAPPDDE